MAGLGFAREQLEKQGWKQGKGLGKEEDGIKEAIKVGIKNDTQGVGYKISDQFTYHWWDHVFNKAAKSIVVNEHEGSVQVSKCDSKYLPISTQRPNKHSQKPLVYGRFVKASGSSNLESSSESEDEESTLNTEDSVFKKCGGRTAHKGARHGLKLNGKLKRIEEHDRVAISAPCSRSGSPDSFPKKSIMIQSDKNLPKSLKKKNVCKSYSDSEEYVAKKKKKLTENVQETVPDQESSLTKNKKKRKRYEKEDSPEQTKNRKRTSKKIDKPTLCFTEKSMEKTKKKRKSKKTETSTECEERTSEVVYITSKKNKNNAKKCSDKKNELENIEQEEEMSSKDRKKRKKKENKSKKSQK